jgi:hypothetical protein
MTDRVHSLTVILEKDIRVDDIEPLIQAIQQFRGVLEVTTKVATGDSMMAEWRARHDLGQKLLKLIQMGEAIQG